MASVTVCGAPSAPRGSLPKLSLAGRASLIVVGTSALLVKLNACKGPGVPTETCRPSGPMPVPVRATV